MKESSILRAILRDLKARKARGEPVWWVKIAGGPLQRPGLPDLHIVGLMCDTFGRPESDEWRRKAMERMEANVL